MNYNKNGIIIKIKWLTFLNKDCFVYLLSLTLSYNRNLKQQTLKYYLKILPIKTK